MNDPNEFRLLDAATGQRLGGWKGAGLRDTTVRPDGRMWAAAMGKSVVVREIPSNAVAFTLEGHTSDVNAVAWSHDGKSILSVALDSTARIWDVATHASAVLRGHDGAIPSLRWSPDDTRVMTGSFDETAKIWDAHSGALLANLTGHAGPVNAVAFSRDGRLVATGGRDKTIRVWSSQGGPALATLEGHDVDVVSVHFMAGDDLIVSTSYDGTVRVWEVASGKLLTIYDGVGYAFAGYPSNDESSLLVSSLNRAPSLWDIHIDRRGPEELLPFLRCRLPFRVDEGRLHNVPLDPSCSARR
jgi:WD40 repeat protein